MRLTRSQLVSDPDTGSLSISRETLKELSKGDYVATYSDFGFGGVASCVVFWSFSDGGEYFLFDNFDGDVRGRKFSKGNGKATITAPVGNRIGETLRAVFVRRESSGAASFVSVNGLVSGWR